MWGIPWLSVLALWFPILVFFFKWETAVESRRDQLHLALYWFEQRHLITITFASTLCWLYSPKFDNTSIVDKIILLYKTMFWLYLQIYQAVNMFLCSIIMIFIDLSFWSHSQPSEKSIKFRKVLFRQRTFRLNIQFLTIS